MTLHIFAYIVEIGAAKAKLIYVYCCDIYRVQVMQILKFEDLCDDEDCEGWRNFVISLFYGL